MFNTSKSISVLGELEEVMIKNGDMFRSRAYARAGQVLMKYTTPMVSIEQLKQEKGIGDTILAKLSEYETTGKLTILEKAKSNPEFIFSNIFGIGPKKAKELVKNGITSVEMLKQQPDLLNNVQQIGLKYYDVLQERIPRSEIQKYDKVFQQVFSSPNSYKIVGSYRRGKSDSGDIDVILKSMELKPIIEYLMSCNLIKEILSLGKHKCLCICRLDQGIYCRVDFLTTSAEEYPFALLYFTGSKIFNTLMRGHALTLGYTMNEHAITKKNKQTGSLEPVDQSFQTEEDIFSFLGIEYREPEKRTDMREFVVNPKVVDCLTIFKTQGVSYLTTLYDQNKDTVRKMMLYCDDAYHNGEESSPLTDHEYDILREFLVTKCSEMQETVGSEVKRDKVTLPYPMASMNKIKPDTQALKNWLKTYKGDYDISYKLDGVSALFYNEGSSPALFTRGNGIQGQNISHLIPYLTLPTTSKCTIRGELIIPKQIFETHYKSSAANARNLVAGLINTKQLQVSKLKHVSFVAYELVYPNYDPIQQKEVLLQHNVEMVKSFKSKDLTNSMLSKMLTKGRENYAYEIDGIIVRQNKYTSPSNSNPKNAFAFKMVLTDQIAEVKVLNILWEASKHGYLKPTLEVEPVNIGGAIIQRATAFNGKYVVEQGLGPGAVVLLTRSGDVIPHVLKVIVSTKPMLPNVDYTWSESGVDICLTEINSNKTVHEKRILSFFQAMNVEGFGPGTVKKLVESGYDTIPSIVFMTVDDFMELDGVQEKSAKKLFNSIRKKLNDASLPSVIGNANIFGRGIGEKKIETLLNVYPDIFVYEITDNQSMINNITLIPGFSVKTAELFVSKHLSVIEFLKSIGKSSKYVCEETITPTQQHALTGKQVVFSGFRNESLKKQLQGYGVLVKEQITKQTSLLLVNDLTEVTSKTEKANKYNIPIKEVTALEL